MHLVSLAGAAIFLLISIGCGHEKPAHESNAPGGTSGGAGAIGTGGATGSGGSSPDDASVGTDCPLLAKTGDACLGGGTLCKPRRCNECIGGLFKIVTSQVDTCVCSGGILTCLPPLPGVTISDCVAEQPLTCAEAADVYTDATCTEHPPCSP